MRRDNAKIDCVLLIDDDKLTNFMNKVLIDETGYFNHVIKKECGQSGLTYLLESVGAGQDLHFPNVILIDIVMPEFSGWEFMEKYRALKNNFPRPPYIFILTSHISYPQSLDKENCMDDLSGVLIKPLTKEILDSVLLITRRIELT